MSEPVLHLYLQTNHPTEQDQIPNPDKMMNLSHVNTSTHSVPPYSVSASKLCIFSLWVSGRGDYGDVRLHSKPGAAAWLCAGAATANTQPSQAHAGRVCVISPDTRIGGDRALAGPESTLQDARESQLITPFSSLTDSFSPL